MSNTTRRAAFFSASLACVAGSAICLGQTGVYEPFAYPPGAELVGRAGGMGFSGPWQSAGYGGWQTGTSGLGRLKVWQLMQGQSGAQSMRSSSGGVQRSLAAPIAGTEGTEVWISFLAKMTGPTEDSWLGVKLPCSGAGADPFLFVGKPYGRANWGVDNGISGGVRESAESALHNVRCVCRVGFHGGADDVTVWVDPVLSGEPDAGSATLHLPGYGDFADLRKVLLETGSVGHHAQGAIDELRIGSSYAEVTPVEEGVVVEGRRFRAAGGRVQVAAGMGMGPHVRAVADPGAPGCGVDVEMGALGASVEVAPGEFMPGSRVEHLVRGVNGAARGGMTVAREADGGISVGGEFPGAHSLHVVTRDESGGVVSEDDYEGEGFFRIINGGGGVIAWGPCVNGEFPHWYHTIELLPYPQLINGVWTWYRYVWAFGCTGNWSSSVRVEVYPQYEGAGVDLAAGTLELRSSGPAPSFDVAHVAEELPQATVRGLGDAILASGCEDGGQCTDPAQRRVRSSGIGSSGQDGVMITGKTAGPLSYLVEGTDLCTAGARMTTTYETEGSAASVEVEGLGDRCMIRPRAGGAGGWLVSVYDQAGVLAGQGHLADGGGIQFVPDCQAPKVPVWGWWYCPVGPNCPDGRIWSVVGCAELVSWHDTDTGMERTIPGTSVFIQPVDNPPILGVVTSTVTAADTTGNLVVSRMSVGAGRPSCPADFNGDGFLDFFDYDDFVGCFETGSCPAGVTADFNGDGFSDFFDYDDFVGAFEAGC